MKVEPTITFLFDKDDLIGELAGIEKSIEARDNIAFVKKELSRFAACAGSRGSPGVYWSLHRCFK